MRTRLAYPPNFQAAGASSFPLKQIRCFIAAAETGRLSHAAAELNLAQSRAMIALAGTACATAAQPLSIPTLTPDCDSPWPDDKTRT
jgi:hypothetical protein